jgi:hypothetical protein
VSAWKDLLRPGYRLLQRGAAAARRPGLLRALPALSTVDPARPVYLFFAPEAGIEPHYVSHAIIARTLKDMGHQVLIVRCEGDYPHCLLMDMNRLGPDKTEAQRKEVCRRCDAVWLRTATAYGLPSISLSALLDDTAKSEIHRQVMEMPADAGTFEVDGFRFGALCGSDLALTRKVLNQMKATGDNRRILEAYVKGALIAYRATQALMKTYAVARVTYFNEYSMVLGAAVAAMRADIPVTRLSQAVYRNIDRSKIMLAAEPLAIYTYHRLLDEWGAWRDLALPPALVDSIAEHSLLRLSGGGHTVYSPKHGSDTDALFDQLGLSRERKLLVAYPSSMDEYYSNMNLMNALGNIVFAQDQPFPSQTAWLQALVTHVESSSDLQLVIRIHPREGRNAHEHLESDNLINLRRDFSGNYAHVRIIWPEEKISSYDLAEIADVALPGWSNIALELARLGIPTLIAFQRYVPYPLDDVVDWRRTPEAYFVRIRELAATPGNFEQVRYAYRWTNVYSLSLSLDFDDLVPAPDFPGLPAFTTPRAAPLVEDIMVRGASVTEINHRALIQTQTKGAPAAETEALRRALRKFIWFLATGENRDDYVLTLAAGEEGSDVALELQGSVATLRSSKGVIVHRSNVIRRMAPFAIQQPAARSETQAALT